MTRKDEIERADEWLEVVRTLQDAWHKMDALAIGDVTTNPSRIKHMLDTPIQEAANYANDWYLKENK